jgi:hypothetical protein
VSKAIAQFDPTAYFPELFAPFFAALATVTQHVDRPPSLKVPAWNALYHLYRVDIRRFLAAASPDDGAGDGEEDAAREDADE